MHSTSPLGFFLIFTLDDNNCNLLYTIRLFNRTEESFFFLPKKKKEGKKKHMIYISYPF